jgi:hypothetical protein
MWFKMETLYFSSLMFLGVGRSERYIFNWSLNYFNEFDMLLYYL